MPFSTQNSQATPLVEVEADAYRPSSCDVAGASASNASPPGDTNASATTNPPPQPSPEFLATVVQAVKLLWRWNRLGYLAQLLWPCQTQANLRRPLACPVRWPLGAFPHCYLRKLPFLLILGQAWLHIPPPQELLLLKVGQLWLFPLLCRPFCPRTSRIHCPLPTWRPRRPRIAFHLLPRCFRPTFRVRLCSWLLPHSCESSRPSGGGEVH